MIRETERTRLRPIGTGDLAWLHPLWTSQAVRRYLWDDEVIPREKTREIIAESIAAHEQQTHGLWSITLTDEPDPIGFTGYWPFFEPPVVQLICGLDPRYWGRGLAHEVSRAMIAVGRATYGLTAIRAATDAPNRASIRALARLGFQLERREVVNGADTLFYRFPDS